MYCYNQRHDAGLLQLSLLKQLAGDKETAIIFFSLINLKRNPFSL